MTVVPRHLPMPAEVVERIHQTPDIFSLRLRLCSPRARAAYRFAPGQFNMLYLPAVGEVPISIVSDPDDGDTIEHTLRAVGRVTRGLARLQPGDQLGLRGPFGRSWPLQESRGRDVLIATGGLGCAPVMAVINYIVARRKAFGRLVIMQGVKHADDLLWRERYLYWQTLPHTQVLVAADMAGPDWPWATGRITGLLAQARFDPADVVAMMCGPEGMMRAVAELLCQRGVSTTRQWLSMERNMKCALGQCGHCQLGPDFVCRDGPVFRYDRVRERLSHRGV